MQSISIESTIEQLFCAEKTNDEIATLLSVSIELVDSVVNRLMREFDEFIASPMPRMSDAEYDQMVSDMHGLEFENGE